MADLAPKPALERAAATIGALRIAPVTHGRITAIAPYPGADIDAGLAPLGVRFPAPGTVSASGAARLVWTGRALAFLFGAAPPDGLAPLAAVSDQTDGWAWMHVSGPDAPALLARLCPLDLRPESFPPGRVARSLIGHMQAIILRDAPEAFEIGVFRSMAETLHHDLTEAARRLAARRAL
ncbi:MAG: hypothetical protein Kow0013_04810 [Pararhodobacter sp.]